MGPRFFGLRFTDPLRIIWLSVLMQYELVWSWKCGTSTRSGCCELLMQVLIKGLVQEETLAPTMKKISQS